MGDKATEWRRQRQKPSEQEKRIMSQKQNKINIYEKFGKNKIFDEYKKLKS